MNPKTAGGSIISILNKLDESPGLIALGDILLDPGDI
jgi:hypothetical protein